MTASEWRIKVWVADAPPRSLRLHHTHICQSNSEGEIFFLSLSLSLSSPFFIYNFASFPFLVLSKKDKNN